MSFRPNTRRVYTSWARAARHATTWGHQTGWKHRVQRYRDWYVVRRTKRRIGPFKPFAKYIGEVRLTVAYDVSIMFPTLDQDEAIEQLRAALGGVPGESH